MTWIETLFWCQELDVRCNVKWAHQHVGKSSFKVSKGLLFYLYSPSMSTFALLRQSRLLRILSRTSPLSLHYSKSFSSQIDELNHDETTVEELRSNVFDFGKKFIAPYADQIDRENSFPSDVNLWKLLGDFGLHGESCRVSMFRKVSE